MYLLCELMLLETTVTTYTEHPLMPYADGPMVLPQLVTKSTMNANLPKNMMTRGGGDRPTILAGARRSSTTSLHP